jgi:hypothetical protein
MHFFNFNFSAIQVIWTVTFAAYLVLLVVLLGRDRARRYPWFTASIVLLTLEMLGKRMLLGRLPQLTVAEIFLTIADLGVLLGLLVVAELARSAFAGMRRLNWIVGAVAMLAVGAGVLAVWGPWPAWKTLTANSPLAVLGLMQLAAQKGELLVSVLTVEIGLLIVLFGRRFKAGWRSHTQQIAIGLSTAAIAELAKQGIYQAFVIASRAHPLNQADYERVIALVSRIFNAKDVVYFAVLLWWIVCLWIDEPGVEIAIEAPAEIPAADEVEETATEPVSAPEDLAAAPLEEEQEGDQ